MIILEGINRKISSGDLLRNSTATHNNIVFLKSYMERSLLSDK